MSNMSYCRFRNTLSDLRDCYENMEEPEDSELSREEERAREQLIILCQQIAEDFGQDKYLDRSFKVCFNITSRGKR